MWVLSLGPSQDLAPFPADPKRQTLAMGPHQTGKRPWESVFLCFLNSIFGFIYSIYYPRMCTCRHFSFPPPREDGGARCMSERRGQTDQIEGLSTSIAKNPVPARGGTAWPRAPPIT